jgi:hypothetical protein
MDMWIARLTATFPHTHSPAKSPSRSLKELIAMAG